MDPTRTSFISLRFTALLLTLPISETLLPPRQKQFTCVTSSVRILGVDSVASKTRATYWFEIELRD